MEGAEAFSMIINALSSMSAGMRGELRKRIEEMDDAETVRLMVETFGVGASSCPSCGGLRRPLWLFLRPAALSLLRLRTNL